MVLLAGIGIAENLRVKRSRIASAPAGMLTLHIQDVVLDLKRNPIRKCSASDYFGGCSDMGFFSLAILTDVT
jgi:hypothetical protein